MINMNIKTPFLVGHVLLKSSLSLEEVGKILSDKIFGGLEFGGKDLEIHDEIPAIFIQSPVIGLKIILDGYSGFGDDQSFNLSISPWISIEHVEREDVRLDNYLFQLLQVELKGVEDIEIFEN